jgi:hypothetical protein
MAMTSTRMVSPATFGRAVELARALAAGLECIVLSVAYGLPVPPERIASMWQSIEMAREELTELEMGAAGVGENARVH